MSSKKSVAKSVAEAGLGPAASVECSCHTCKYVNERIPTADLKIMYPNMDLHDASISYYMKEYAMKQALPASNPVLQRRNAAYYMQSEGLGGASTKRVVSDEGNEGDLVPIEDDSFPFMVANFNIYGAADVEECDDDGVDYDSDGRKDVKSSPSYYSRPYSSKRRVNYRDPMA